MLAVLFFGKYVKIMLVMTNRAKNYERNNSQHCWTRLAVVTSALAVLCKQIQQLPTMLGPAVHRGKDTSPKTLKPPCVMRVRGPNNVGGAAQLTDPTLLRYA